MVFFIVGCVKRRSTRTTTVLSCLSLTTTPWSVRFGISFLVLFLRFALQRGNGLDTRDVAAHLAHPRGVGKLTGRPLEPKVELLLLELQHFVVELVDRHPS